MFPDIKLQGCIFHWVQCIWRKVQEFGLQPSYNQRQAIYDYIRRCMALPFLPHQHMRPAFDHLASQANSDQLRRLIYYMSDTWFESSVFPLSSLSVFGLAIRTNNDVEGKHLLSCLLRSTFTLYDYHQLPDWFVFAVQITHNCFKESICLTCLTHCLLLREFTASLWYAHAPASVVDLDLIYDNVRFGMLFVLIAGKYQVSVYRAIETLVFYYERKCLKEVLKCVFSALQVGTGV